MTHLRLVVSNDRPMRKVGIALVYPVLWVSAAVYFFSLICWNCLHSEDE